MPTCARSPRTWRQDIDALAAPTAIWTARSTTSSPRRRPGRRWTPTPPHARPCAARFPAQRASTATRTPAPGCGELSERLTVRRAGLRPHHPRRRAHDRGPARPTRRAAADFIDAHPPGDDGLVTITTDYPDYLPFRTFARDAAARRELTVAFLNRGWPANDAVAARDARPARREGPAARATRAGPTSTPRSRWSAPATPSPNSSSGSPTAAARRRPPRPRRAAGAAAAATSPTPPPSTPRSSATTPSWSGANTTTSTPRRCAATSTSPGCAPGCSTSPAACSASSTAPVDAPRGTRTSPPTTCCADGAACGRIYLDLHPRDGKYKHAAQFDLVGGITGRQLPEGVLVCNFPRGLMEHDDVVTLFHEFGHLVHHVLGGDQRLGAVLRRRHRVGLRRGAVADARGVGLGRRRPAHVRGRRGRQADPGRAGRRGCARPTTSARAVVRTQMFYAAVSYVLHRDRPADLTAARAGPAGALRPVRPAAGHPLPRLVRAPRRATRRPTTPTCGAWSSPRTCSPRSTRPTCSTRTSRTATATGPGPGGRRDAADLVADFLGRPFTFDAFAAWLDRAPVPVSR